MTAAATTDDDGDRSLHCPPSLSSDDDIPTLTLINQQEQEAFYNKFVQFFNSFNTATQQTNNNIITPTPATSNGVDNTDWLLADDNNTHKPHLLSNQDSSTSVYIPSSHSITGIFPNTNTSQPANDTDWYHLSLGNTANKGVNCDKLSTATPCPNDEYYNYKAKLKEIDHACHQMMTYWMMVTNNDKTAPTDAIPNAVDSNNQPHEDKSFDYKAKLKEIDKACTQLETFWTMAWVMAPTALQPGPTEMTTSQPPLNLPPTCNHRGVATNSCQLSNHPHCYTTMG